MGAAVIALAEVRERKQRAEYRQQLHACFDRWLDTLEIQMKDPKPPLEDLTHAVWKCRQELTGQLTATLLEQRFAAEQAQRQAPCPRCGRVVEARAVPARNRCQKGYRLEGLTIRIARAGHGRGRSRGRGAAAGRGTARPCSRRAAPAATGRRRPARREAPRAACLAAGLYSPRPPATG